MLLECNGGGFAGFIAILGPEADAAEDKLDESTDEIEDTVGSIVSSKSLVVCEDDFESLGKPRL